MAKKKKDNQIQYCVEFLQSFLPNMADAGRGMDRKFIIHAGPTNSGKTYNALQALKAAGDGVYLGPLRLLALEMFDTLNADGYPCSLLTGEEYIGVPNSSFTASTIEMCDYGQWYSAAVIDECQMLGDPVRGGHWLKAICSIKAREIHLCTAPEAIGLIRRLMSELGAEHEVVKHERLAPLEYAGVLKDIKMAQKGDAFITFSRKGVLSIAAALEKENIKASVIYGALPPQARREEVRRFTSGETSVVVATDAIGMGVSLPIRRIIFCQTEKFDGTSRRELKAEEVLQIAGRAGRYGIYDVGYVLSMDSSPLVSKSLKRTPEQLRRLTLPFPTEALDSHYPLEMLLEAWRRVPEMKGVRKVDMAEAAALYSRLKPLLPPDFPKAVAYSYVCCPVGSQSYGLVEYWLDCCRALIQGKSVPEPDFPDGTLEQCEELYRALDIQHQMGRRGKVEIDNSAEKERVCKKINDLLKANKAGFLRRCSSCGQPLPVNSPFGMCEDCYNRRWDYDFDDDDFEDDEDEYFEDDDEYEDVDDGEKVYGLEDTHCFHLEDGTWDWKPAPPKERGTYPVIEPGMSDNEIENIRSDQMCSDYLWYAKLCEEYAFRHLVCESAKIIRSGVEVFRWYNDGCPWDRSGDVKDTGRVLSPENTWSEFLGCYTGAWMPTFESGCGKRFSTYDADLEEMIEELRFEIACAVVEAYCARYGDELYPGVKKHKYQGKYEAGDIADRMGVLDLTWDVLNDLPVTTINVPLSEVLRLSEEFSNDPIALPEFTFADGWTKDS